MYFYVHEVVRDEVEKKKKRINGIHIQRARDTREDKDSVIEASVPENTASVVVILHWLGQLKLVTTDDWPAL